MVSFYEHRHSTKSLDKRNLFVCTNKLPTLQVKNKNIIKGIFFLWGYAYSTILRRSCRCWGIQTLDGGVPGVEQVIGGGCGDRVVDLEHRHLNAIGWNGLFLVPGASACRASAGVKPGLLLVQSCGNKGLFENASSTSILQLGGACWKLIILLILPKVLVQ